jgi:hypothetical protein
VAFTALAVCMGPTTLHYAQEALRLLAIPQAFALVALVGLRRECARHDVLRTAGSL